MREPPGMTAPDTVAAPEKKPVQDERLANISWLRQVMRRPELGAVAGLIVVIVFFIFAASGTMFTVAGLMTVLRPAAVLGIMSIAAALLMIGGEFDLSIGSMVAFAGLIFGVLLVNLHLPLIVAIIGTLAMAAIFGVINGQLVIRTKLNSFIVTLGFLFILRGLSLVGLKLATGGNTELSGIQPATPGFVDHLFSGDTATGLFSWMTAHGMIAKLPNGQPSVHGVPVSVVWFLAITAFATWLLLGTRFGNWIFASGGDANAARNSGVPVDRVKTLLFVGTALASALVAIITSLNTASTDALRGYQLELEAIIAAVVGGCLLNGGYGSAIGTFFGALIFGTVEIGLTYTDIDTDWFKVFLGAMLLIAVMFNNALRRRVTGER
ncbi:MAG TPA: ABC transporter permease [Acidiphilium sp.]